MITFYSAPEDGKKREKAATQTIPSYKRKHQSHMKAPLLIQPSSRILFPPSKVLLQWWHSLQSLGHVSHRHQKSHVEMQKEAEKGSRLSGLAVSQRRKRLTLPSALPVLNPCGRRQELCGFSLPLIMGQPSGIKREQKLNLFM